MIPNDLEEELECVGNNWLHDYVIIDQIPSQTREVCKRCKKEKIFFKGDNRTYYWHHIRDYLQPGQKYHSREWGNPNLSGTNEHERDKDN